MTRPLIILLWLPVFLAYSPVAVSVETGITLGVHDFVVTGITPSSLHDGGSSHTPGVNAGAFLEHTTASGIVLGGFAEAYVDMDRDKLDPDHFPIWFRFNVYANGPVHAFTANTRLSWLLEMQNKMNTVSGIEREIKNNYGLGLAYDNQHAWLGVNLYGGFFYLEIDDDAPRQFAGYDREDLGNGTASVSIRLSGGLHFTRRWRLDAQVQNWTSAGVGSHWLENEYKLDLVHELGAGSGQEGSSLHLSIIHTRYNLDGYYRPDLGRPVLPWDNDTLIRAYVRIPWVL